MKEADYILATDLARLRVAKEVIAACYCLDDPNKNRKLSIMVNIGLMITDLEKKVDRLVR